MAAVHPCAEGRFTNAPGESGHPRPRPRGAPRGPVARHVAPALPLPAPARRRLAERRLRDRAPEAGAGRLASGEHQGTHPVTDAERERMREVASRVAAAAPPLTEEQRARLRL